MNKRYFLGYENQFLHSVTEWLTKESQSLSDALIILPSERAKDNLQTLLRSSKFGIRKTLVTDLEFINNTCSDSILNLSNTNSLLEVFNFISASENHEEFREYFFNSGFTNLIKVASSINQTLRKIALLEIDCTSIFDKIYDFDCSEILKESLTKKWSFFKKIEKHFQSDTLTSSTAYNFENIIIANCSFQYPIFRRNLLNQDSFIHTLIFADKKDKDLFDEIGMLIPEKWVNKKDLPLERCHVDFCSKELHQFSYLNEEKQVSRIVLCNKKIANTLIEVSSVTKENSSIPFTTIFNSEFEFKSINNFVNFILNCATSEKKLKPQEILKILSNPFTLKINDFYEEFNKAKKVSILALLKSEFISFCLSNSPEFIPLGFENKSFQFSEELEKFFKELEKTFSLFDKDLQEEGRKPLLFWNTLIKNIFSFDEEDSISRHIIEYLEFLDNLSESLIGFELTLEEFFNLIEEYCSVTPRKPKVTETNQNPKDVPTIIGWLDSLHDISSRATLLSFNQNYVPGNNNSISYIPELIRKQLCIAIDQLTDARDIYFLWGILNSKETRIVIPRNNNSGDSLLPSKLLYHTSDSSLINIIKRYTQKEDDYSSTDYGQVDSKIFEFPSFNTTWEKLGNNSVSVRALKEFVNSPYKFILKYGFNVDSPAEYEEQLHVSTFGNIIHDFIHYISKLESKGDFQPDNFDSYFENYISKRFKIPLTSFAKLQLYGLRDRARNFINYQNDWIKLGWKTVATELPLSKTFQFSNNKTITLKGRVDRIDYNPELKQFAIIDYKSSDTAVDPTKSHIKKPRNSDAVWTDFQLPAYGLLINGSDLNRKLNFPILSENIKYLYCNLPKANGPLAGFQIAKFEQDEIKIAFSEIENVLEIIASKNTWEYNE